MDKNGRIKGKVLKITKKQLTKLSKIDRTDVYGPGGYPFRFLTGSTEPLEEWWKLKPRKKKK